MSSHGCRSARVLAAAAVVGAAVAVAAVAVPARTHGPGEPAALTLVGRDTPEVLGDPQSPTPTFVLVHGRYTAFDVPGPTLIPQDITAINNRGQVAGGYKEDVSGDSGFRGYLRNRDGRFTLVDVPGAAGTQPNDLNDRGEIVGTFSDSNSCTGCADDARGFRRDARGDYTRLHPPGAVASQAFGVNNRGEVTGEYLAGDGSGHGYRWRAGRFTTVDVPGATATSVTDINDRGAMIGLYLDAGGAIHAFLRDPHGRVATIDAPGATLTFPFGLNNRGQVAGFTAASLPISDVSDLHGFVLTGGGLTRVDVPGATQTLVSDINDRGAVVGLYSAPSPGPQAPDLADDAWDATRWPMAGMPRLLTRGRS